MDLKQIEAKLNSEFQSDSRKLVFWFDEKGQFVDDIDSIKLENAQVYRLEKDNTFYTKYFFEKVDTTTNYLVYAPFAKPPIESNHLIDTIRYSKEFFADKQSIMMSDLRIPTKYRNILSTYSKFFASNERTNKFYDLHIESWSTDVIETGIMSVICKARTLSFDEIVRIILVDGDLENNKYLAEFAKYDIEKKFWEKCNDYYGYYENEPSLEKFAINILVTHTDYGFRQDLPLQLQKYVLSKKNNVDAFASNFMNNLSYTTAYDRLASHVSSNVKLKEILKKIDVERFVDVDTFADFDEAIIEKLKEILLSDNKAQGINGYTFREVCKNRLAMHYRDTYKHQYELLKSAFYMVNDASKYKPGKTYEDMVKNYISQDYLIDGAYREFYYHYDALEDNSGFEEVKQLVENMYTNTYLTQSANAWSREIEKVYSDGKLTTQKSFYNKFVRNIANKKRLVVIVSDAFRFECAKEFAKYVHKDTVTDTSMSYMVSTMPSYTALGMASLLPNSSIRYDSDFGVLVDDMPTETTEQRQAILQKYQPNAVCLGFNQALNMKKEDYKQLQGKNLIYIYHNQVDARGDKKASEHEVFNACQDSMVEIAKLVNRLSRFISASEFILTADHGFIYKRESLHEFDKVSIGKVADSQINRRFIISREPMNIEGSQTIDMKSILGKNADTYVTIPNGTDIFKVQGGGMNYVHGGASLQEMIVPVLSIKTSKDKKDVISAPLILMSLSRRITNLITYIDFLQQEPVGEGVEQAVYKLCFEDAKGNRISNEVIIVAGKKDLAPEKRAFKEKFTFKTGKYESMEKYYLVVYDAQTDAEQVRYEYMIDIAFADDFGF